MAETVEDILAAIAPEFADIDESRQATLIAVAESRTGSVYPSGDVRNMAVALMAAHMQAVVDGGGAGGGPVSSESVGPLSISYATAAGSSDLSSTGYGRQLIEMREAYVFAPRTRLG